MVNFDVLALFMMIVVLVRLLYSITQILVVNFVLAYFAE